MTHDELQQIQKLSEKLALGFYVNNLYDIASILRDPPLAVTQPTASFVLRKIAEAIADEWDEQILPAAEAQRVTHQLTPEFHKVLGIIESGEGKKLHSALDSLILAFMNLKS